MHRAALAQKARAKLLEHLIGIHQDLVKILDMLFVIRGVMAVLVIGSGIGKLCGQAVDVDFNS